MKNRIPIKITLIYFIIGFLWILFSDRLLLLIAGSSDTITVLQTYKGWFYVSATSVFLYLLISVEIKRKNKIEADLIEAKKKAEESEQLKSAFISNMSHEIRTPLNGIMGFCELLLDDSFSEDDKKIFAANVTKNSSDLLRLINDIMDISRLQGSQLDINRKKFNINNFLSLIYADYKDSDLAKERTAIEFALITPPASEKLEIYSDRTNLTHIFQKLLNNAFFFTHQGFIRFGYQVKGSEIEFFVEDSGCGLTGNHDQFFKPFYKGQNQVIGSKGFGLGLAISKGLTNLLGGDLQVISEKDKGSRFYFSLNIDEPAQTRKK